ncbi:hypothetical protein M9458_040760, partial [Cirrhinus mrigala]
MDYSQNSAPLMTPPISPAMINRSSVINQGPMAVRPQSSCPIQPQVACQAFSDTMYQSLHNTSSGSYPNSSYYQPVFRAQTHTPTAAYQARAESSRYAPFSGHQLTKDCFSSSCTVDWIRSLRVYSCWIPQHTALEEVLPVEMDVQVQFAALGTM